MRTLETSTALLLLLAAAAGGARKTYEGYRLLETEVLSLGDAGALWAAGALGDWDFWSTPRAGGRARVFASPQQREAVEGTLRAFGVGFHTVIHDMRRALAASPRPETPPATGRSISFTHFNNLTEIHAYLEALADAFPELVTLLSAGRSSEGRELAYVKISDGSGGGDARAIFIDAAIHAREWIAPPVALYAIRELVENYEENKQLLDGVEWFILPVLNPDGYEYTFTAERFWRKTRSFNGDASCLGVDANRNFEDHWLAVGSSSNKCSLTYAGPIAASEPETQALEKLLAALGPRLHLYLTLHSYGQYLLLPYGYSTDPIEDYDELLSLGKAAAAALEAVRGTKYIVGNSAAVLYATSGSSQDWAKSGAGVKYSYTLELPGGGTGFDPPPSAILPVATETFEAIRVFGNHVSAGRRK